MTLDDFWAMPEIYKSLPLTFPPGNQKFTKISVICNECKRNIFGIDFRGYVIPINAPGDYRNAPKVIAYHLEGYGYCCKKITVADYIFREDMTMTGLNPDSGEEKTWGMRKLTRWERFVDFFKKEKSL